MPYIKQEDRVEFDNMFENLPALKTKGELEYCIFYLMREYMDTRDFNYSNLHDVVYCAQHCCDEFRRRFLDVRENEAREKNGDI